MTKNILLVESRKHIYALMSTMKFSTYFKKKGYNVEHIVGKEFFGLPKKVDKVVASCVFTFDLPEFVDTVNYYKGKYQLDGKDVHVGGTAVSMIPDYVKEQCGNVDIHTGICDKIDRLPLDYTLYPDIDYSMVHTTRGCVRKCNFCAVHKIEPLFCEVEEWEKMVNMHKPNLLVLDNNFTACSNEWFERVCKRLAYFNKTVDICEAIDIRLFDEFHAKCLTQVKLKCLRFAYDGNHVKPEEIIKGVTLANKYGLKDLRFYCLYNWKDTPEELYDRMNLLNELDCKIYPMKYIPLDALDRKYVGKNWTEERLKAFWKVMGKKFVRGIIGNQSRNNFLEAAGNSPEEFVKKLDDVHIDKKGKIDDKQFILDGF